MPAWLNLDGYMPPEVRERVADARGRLTEALPMLEELGKHLAEVYLDVQDHLNSVDCPIDDHDEVFDRWTGLNAFYDEVVGAADNIACAVGESIRTDDPEWYLDVRAARLPEPTTTEEVQS